MEAPGDADGRRARRQRALAGLVLVPGLLVAGMTVRDAVMLRAQQGRIIELRGSLHGWESEVRKVKARRELASAGVTLLSGRLRSPDPTPGWERVLASVPPEATLGRVVFCREGVTIHGRPADEARLARLASDLEANAEIERVELDGQGSDDVVLTVVSAPIAATEDLLP